MKLVKYFSMLLVVLISNGSCSTGSDKTNGNGTTTQPPPTDIPQQPLFFEVMQDISSCDTNKMEMIQPNSVIAPGRISYKRLNGDIDFIDNPGSGSVPRRTITFPSVTSESGQGFNAGISISTLNSRGMNLKLGGNYDTSKKINFSISMLGTEISTLDGNAITQRIIDTQGSLLQPDYKEPPVIYKSIVYARGIKYKFEKENNSSGMLGVDLSKTDAFEGKIGFSTFKVDKTTNTIEETFDSSQVVLFCKTKLSEERIRTDIASRTPSISYRVNLQDQGCGNPGTSEDNDGSHNNQITSYAQQIYLFSFNLKNQPNGCKVKYVANTDGVVYSNGGGRAGHSGCSAFIEKIRAKLEGCPANWNVNYRVNSRRSGSDSGLGDWQSWKCNDDWSGVDDRKIVAMEAKITTNNECLR